MTENKLTSRDLITTGVFSVLFALIAIVCSLTVGMTPYTYPFTIAIAMVPCGIVWTYLRVKVPKRFAILIQCVVLALLLFVAGAGWSITLGAFAGGLLAEGVSGIGKYRNFRLNIMAYAGFGLCFHFGVCALMLLARDYYYTYCITHGMDADYMNVLLDFMGWSIFGISGALVITGAVLGMFMGKMFLKKHFIKAGIV